MKSFHMQNRLKRGHSGKRQYQVPIYRGGQGDAGNAAANAQSHALNKRYNMDESASANDFREPFNNSNDEVNASAPAHLSAEALPSASAGRPIVPGALGDQQPI